MSSCAIFIRSYQKDFPWLAFALRSLQKYSSGFAEIIVAIPEGQHLSLTAETVIHVHDSQPGYMAQQVDKLNADLHAGADYILHTDSDVCWTAPFTQDFFFYQEKPIWTFTPWSAMEPRDKRNWFHVMAKCLQEAPEHEFMRKCATIVPAWLHRKFREFIERTHGMTMEQYVMSQPGHEFSEFNCLGFFAWLYYREHFHWHDTSVDGVPDWPFRQRWSWAGITPEARHEMELATA